MKTSNTCKFCKYSLDFGFFFSALFLFISWRFTQSVGFRIFMGFVFISIWGLYIIKYSNKKDSLFTKIVDWSLLAFLALMYLVYIFISLNLKNFAVSTLYFIYASLIIIFWIIIKSKIVNMLKTSDYTKILVSYFIVTLLIITMFCSFYQMYKGDNKNGIIISDNKEILLETKDYVYYSWATYYSMFTGFPNDLKPVGDSRFMMMTEITLSVIFHIIILGAAISNLNNKEIINNKVT